MKHDSRLCLQVATHLASLGSGGRVNHFYCPDEPQHTKDAKPGQQHIDLVARTTSGEEFALEHTTVESYENQLHEGRQLVKLLVPLQTQLAGQLPGDRRFQLAVPIGAVRETSLDPDHVLSELKSWILKHAPALPAGSPIIAPRHQLRGQPPEVPVAVVLTAWPLLPSGRGGLTVARLTDDEDTMKQLRVERLRRALDDKLPKLLHHSQAHTVLVLEDVDLALSNTWINFGALQHAAKGLALSDTIVLLETSVPPSCGIVVLSRGCWLNDFDVNRFFLPDVEDIACG